tara:strand:- start:1075 stop:1725 length:651 start_codon:yes stop_codon:yes gene_type:complete
MKKLLIKNNNIEILDFTINQLNNFFPFKKKISHSNIKKEFNNALEKSLNCFKKIKTKYHQDNSDLIFNSDKYCVFLYFLSNEVYKNNQDKSIAERIYYLNKTLNGVDLYYEVTMPEIFYLVHPVGTVLGRANYSNYFVAYQNCTVGSNKNNSPTLGQYVTMRPGSSIIGNSNISSGCDISINSTIVDKNLTRNSIYIGSPSSFHIKKKTRKNKWFD